MQGVALLVIRSLHVTHEIRDVALAVSMCSHDSIREPLDGF
jgi:hypothetical protein